MLVSVNCVGYAPGFANSDDDQNLFGRRDFTLFGKQEVMQPFFSSIISSLPRDLQHIRYDVRRSQPLVDLRLLKSTVGHQFG